jgi:hypothetical protein
VIGPDGGGSTLTWTFAVDPEPALVDVIRGARDIIGGVFTGAMASFAAYLSPG